MLGCGFQDGPQDALAVRSTLKVKQRDDQRSQERMAQVRDPANQRHYTPEAFPPPSQGMDRCLPDIIPPGRERSKETARLAALVMQPDPTAPHVGCCMQ